MEHVYHIPEQKEKETFVFYTTLLKNMKVLVATEKPFAKVAVDGIREVVEKAGYQLILLEKYTAKEQLLEAVADADALIIRSDNVDAEVLDAAKQLKIVVRAGAGYDNIDLAAATAHSVVAMNTPGQNSNAVAELALGLMVSMLTAMWVATWRASRKVLVWRSMHMTHIAQMR